MKYQPLSVAVLLLILTLAKTQETPACVENPKEPLCQDFKLPKVRDYIDELCDMMWMPGCTVDKICHNSKYNNSQTTDNICSEFSVMVDICDEMSMGVIGCAHWKQMCKPEDGKTVVKQCKTPNLTQALPTTRESKDLVKSICTEMPMDGCDRCAPGDNQCDYLEVYSTLCIQMPEMEQCGKWKTMCESIPTWPLCSSDNNDDAPPIMRMYFHTGIKDYVLFKEWVPTSTAGYVGTWFVVFFMGILFDLIKFVRSKLEDKWRNVTDSPYQKVNDTGGPQPSNAFRWSVDIPRGGLQALETTWGYFVMLIAMTFNVGLFVAVIAGSFAGTVIFGRFIAYQPKASCH